MTHSPRWSAAALLAAATILGPAQAQEGGQPQGEDIVVTGKKAEKDVVTQAVKIGDLDLATDTGVGEMEKRVTSAVDYICAIPAVVGYYKQKAETPCRDEAWASARPQMDREIERARAPSGGQ